jgi:phospholipase/carboxylesterase
MAENRVPNSQYERRVGVNIIDGPRLPPASGEKTQALIVLLHGYGSNGDDLIGLAPYWKNKLTHAQFVSPNAPDRVAGTANGFQWFPLSRMDERELELGVERASATLNRFIDHELARVGLDESKLALVGFSQGTMMALHVGLRREKAPACIVGFSGALAAPHKLKNEAKSNPPILLVHGDRDDVIPLGAMFEAARALGECERTAQWHISYGVPHSIGPDGLDLAGAFLSMTLKSSRGVLV